MKKLLLFTFVFISMGLSAQLDFGKSELINNQWKFSLSDFSDAKNIDFKDEKWKTVDLPHDWSVKGVLSPDNSSCTGFLPGGIAWYRKTVLIPESKSGQKVYVYFEGVYNRSDVYINGHLLGHRPNGYISFAYDLTDYVKFGGENVISVRVDHSREADSRWYSGSGIYRDVYLVYSEKIHFSQWGIHAYPKTASVKKGELAVHFELENETKQVQNIVLNSQLLSHSKEVVGTFKKKIVLQPGKNTISGLITVKNPGLWSVENPALYSLESTLISDKKQLDQSEITTGFREFKFDADNGFTLNGKSMKLKGVCLHHDAGVLGSAAYPEVWKDRLSSLKKLGVNAIRTSHNPQAPYLYALCDELGILVLNEAYDEWEFPKRKWIEGWNVGKPGFEGTFDYFEEWGERDLRDFVRRDRNHLSVFAWSIGNEVDYPNDPYSHPVLDGGSETGFTQAIFGGYKKEAPDAQRLGVIAKKLVKVVHESDPSRPATAGLAGVAMSNQTDYPGALDICGYNYTESLYDSDHIKYPKRVLYGSENRHDYEAWKAVTDRKFVAGQFLWTGVDYLGESGRWPSRGFYSGLIDFAGNIKPRGYFRQALWSEKPVIYAGTYPVYGRRQGVSMDAWPVWNYENGQTIRVVAYTNSPEAQLLINGVIVGDKKAFDTNTGIIFWDIPYQEGKIEVQGIKKDQVESRFEIKSTGRPFEIKIAEQDIKTSGFNTIKLQIVDENGEEVFLSDNEIHCRILGNAELTGMEAGNNEDMGDYTDAVQRAYHGKLNVYLKTKGEKVKVIFTSPLLKSTEITIE